MRKNRTYDSIAATIKFATDSANHLGGPNAKAALLTAEYITNGIADHFDEISPAFKRDYFITACGFKPKPVSSKV